MSCVVLDVFEEGLDQVYAAVLASIFGRVIIGARRGILKLDLPEDFPLEGIEKFQDDDVDLRKTQGENGLSLKSINDLLIKNQSGVEKVLSVIEDDAGDIITLADMISYFQNKPDDSPWQSGKIFLEVFRALDQDISCVYGIFKDTQNKVLIVTFRGSKDGGIEGATRDWESNFNFFHRPMDTPELAIRSGTKEIFVHEGMYRYLFENEFLKQRGKQQAYSRMVEDIESLIQKGNPDGYKVYMTGHSLGGALATLAAFKLGGSNDDWIPKPITSINFASPFVGTQTFRNAFQELEQNGDVRCLRIVNTSDPVPAVSPFTLGAWSASLNFWDMFPKLNKHVGINIRLSQDGIGRPIHPAGLGFFSSITNAMRNSLLKPWWRFVESHTRKRYVDLFQSNKTELSTLTIDKMYRDRKVVGPDFRMRS